MINSELAALAVTAYTLSKPFFEKTGEGIARKVGEDIWNLLKKPFSAKKGNEVSEATVIEADFKQILMQELQDHPELLPKLQKIISDAQMEIRNLGNQNITNNAEIQKQLNITTNTGSINL